MSKTIRLDEQACKVTNINPRAEKHGDEDKVVGVDVSIELVAPVELLEQLEPPPLEFGSLDEIPEFERKAWEPPEQITASEWSARHRILDRKNANEAGPWRNERTPYLREIMDTIGDPLVERVAIQKSTQVGGTEAINNMLGWAIDQQPGPTLVVYPTKKLAEKILRRRIKAMVESCERLSDKLDGNSGGVESVGDSVAESDGAPSGKCESAPSGQDEQNSSNVTNRQLTGLTHTPSERRSRWSTHSAANSTRYKAGPGSILRPGLTSECPSTSAIG